MVYIMVNIMVYMTISLRMPNWEKWKKVFNNFLTLVLGYSVFILTAVKYIPLRISSALRKHDVIHFSLLHLHAHTASFTSLQLHHRMSFIKLNCHSYIITRP